MRPELVIPASVTWNDESYDVVSVLRGIQNNTNLTSVDIQAPITSLNNNSLFMAVLADACRPSGYPLRRSRRRRSAAAPR